MIRNEIRTFIIDTFLFGDGGRLTDTTPLLESHVVDSTGVLEIVSFLENHFGITVDDDDLRPENLNSVEKIAGFLERKKGG